MTVGMVSRELVLEILSEVKDPELPMIDVVELGIVRDVVVEGDQIRVDITPTYSGCPAMQVIEREIVYTLESHGFDNVTVRMIFSPAWTTDWMTEAARARPESARDRSAGTNIRLTRRNIGARVSSPREADYRVSFLRLREHRDEK
jgi:Predicted metal-sulfur cluster biosynthetic enzyme